METLPQALSTRDPAPCRGGFPRHLELEGEEAEVGHHAAVVQELAYLIRPNCLVVGENRTDRQAIPHTHSFKCATAFKMSYRLEMA